MTCTNPWQVKHDGEIFDVPCRKCTACRIQYAREWAYRLLMEAKDYGEEASFLTFTYDDDHLPKDLSLKVDILQRLQKRIRKSVEPKKLRFFSCGEYGDGKGERAINPHYHAICLGLPPGKDTQQLLEKSWEFGFVYVGSVTYESCRYVTQYVLKKYNGDKAKKEYGERVPPFRLMSKGIGKRYCLDNAERFRETGVDYIRGKEVSLPRYFANLLELSTESRKVLATMRMREIADKCLEKDPDPDLIRYFIKSSNKQKEKNLTASIRMKEGKL